MRTRTQLRRRARPSGDSRLASTDFGAEEECILAASKTHAQHVLMLMRNPS